MKWNEILFSRDMENFMVDEKLDSDHHFIDHSCMQTQISSAYEYKKLTE